MGSEVIILPIMFGVVFGVIYLFISSRHKERLALIDKGADASIFYSNKKTTSPIWKVLILNLAMILFGIGLGIFIAGMLHYNLGVDENIAFPGTIFTLAGAGLFAGFKMSQKLD
ncbi:hypothetical protein E7Z59_14430 [Robertkochia marina]|uniref:Peptidase A2 domain-containing protein n=1 Tax=Robertkochia marina TaxID=1227945 RepID=A0A4V3UXU9_9FLAO|nr:DUF6249 domain-containing protein [Robertkochia marina]THD65780.1 hypothetical protein E7Z59_14430 [Robertkochia marina]TRZ46536.1 hypothetical protein D3A96_02920 [Robertkochia marina]